LCRCKATTSTNASTLKYSGTTNIQMHFNMEQLQTCTHFVKCMYPSHSSNWILPCASCLHNHDSNTTQMLPKGCPNVAQRLHKSCPKAAQKLPRSHPKATPKLPESYPNIFIGLPEHMHIALFIGLPKQVHIAIGSWCTYPYSCIDVQTFA